jgi:hypothetical protein
VDCGTVGVRSVGSDVSEALFAFDRFFSQGCFRS